MKFNGSGLAEVYPDLRLLSICFNAGEGIVQILEGMSEFAFERKTKKAFLILHEEIVGGQTLANALAKTEEPWNNAFLVEMIRQREINRQLEEGLNEAVELVRLEVEVKDRLRPNLDKKKIVDQALWLQMLDRLYLASDDGKNGPKILNTLRTLSSFCDKELADVTLTMRARVREGEAIAGIMQSKACKEYFISPVILAMRTWENPRIKTNVLLEIADLLEELALYC